MSIPDSPNTTYNPGGTPPIKSADLNDLQKYLVQAFDVIKGPAVDIYDEFTGQALDLSRWATEAAWTFPDDSTNDACGCAKFTSSSLVAANLLTSSRLAPGTRDFFAFARLRISALGGTTSFVKFGLQIGGSGDYSMSASPNNGNSNWWLLRGPDIAFDSGVPFSATYQHLAVVRRGGTLLFFINGALVDAFVPGALASLTGYQFGAQVQNTSSTTTTFIDSMKLWIPR